MLTLFPPAAVRSATSGYWRMLTLGAEYEDTWCAPSPAKSHRRRQQLEEEPCPVEEKDTGAGGPQETPTWRPVHTNPSEKHDAVWHLDDLSTSARGDGVRQMLTKHEALNSTISPHR